MIIPESRFFARFRKWGFGPWTIAGSNPVSASGAQSFIRTPIQLYGPASARGRQQCTCIDVYPDHLRVIPSFLCEY